MDAELPPIEVTVHGGVAFLPPHVRNGRDVGVGVVVHQDDVFGYWADFGFVPDFGECGWHPVIPELGSQPKECDLTRPSERLSAGFEWTPVHGTIASWRGTFALAARAGFGLVHTSDDLDELQCPGEAVCEVTKDQYHPDTVVGARLIVAPRPRWALSLGVEHIDWIETLESTDLERYGATFVDAAASIRLGRPSPPG